MDTSGDEVYEKTQSESEIDYAQGLEDGWEAQRLADADLVRAAGCLCFVIETANAGFTGQIDDAWDEQYASRPQQHVGDFTRTVILHDHRCPHALADVIENKTQTIIEDNPDA